MKWFFGWLLIRVRGNEALRFINLCKANGISLWNVQEVGEDSINHVYHIEFRLKDYKQIKPLVKKTRVKVAIVRRSGLPFLLYKVYQNKGFLTGLIVFLAILFYSQTLIWKIEITGNYMVSTNELEKFLFQNGVYEGMSKQNMKYNKMEKDILNAFEDISWCSFKLGRGTLILTVNETAIVKSVGTSEDKKGMNLVANVDGRIEEMVVREGVPNAKKGQEVQKGDVLVIGRLPILDETGEIDRFEEVSPSAKISISYDYFYADTIGRKQIQKEYTGRTKYGILWKGEKIIYGDFRDYDIQYLTKIPVGKEYVTIIRLMEYQKKEYLLDDFTAENILRKKMEFFVNSFIEKGVQIIANDVKIIGSVDSFRMEGAIRMQGEFDE